jgi:predicted ribosome-associated RNA-binding protein Tma20
MSVEGHTIPDLKTVHKYPDLYPRFTVDEGAIKFILKGILNII